MNNMASFRKKHMPQGAAGTAFYPNLTALDADDQFKLLRPSKELLYYRRKLNKVDKEILEMTNKVETCKSLCEKRHEFELEHQRRNTELFKLQEAVSDLQVHLYQERDQVLRLYAENDRLKIRAIQDRKKIGYLLSITPAAEKEVNFITTKPWTDVVPQKRATTSNYVSTSKTSKLTTTSTSATKCSCSTDVAAVVLQNEALSSQLEEQTRLFQDNFQTLLKDRELQRQEASALIEQSQEKMVNLSSELIEAQRRLCDTVKEVLVMKEEHLKNELVWTTERDMLLKSWEKMNTDVPLDHNVKGDGCCNRGHKLCASNELHSLKDELTRREHVIEMYQEQCILLEQQTTTLRKQLETVKMKNKERIEKLQQTITLMKTKYNQLDQRRRLEGEGFRSDVRLLKNRLQDLERNVVKQARGVSTAKSNPSVIFLANNIKKNAVLLKEVVSSLEQKILYLDKLNK